MAGAKYLSDAPYLKFIPGIVEITNTWQEAKRFNIKTLQDEVVETYCLTELKIDNETNYKLARTYLEWDEQLYVTSAHATYYFSNKPSEYYISFIDQTTKERKNETN